MTAADFAAAERLPPGEIPVVDCSRSEPTLAAAIHDAATRIGFFHLVGYGIPQALMDQALAVAQRFFALSQTDKASIAVDRTISAVGWPAWRARQRTISRRFSSGVGRSRREDPDLPVGLPSPGRPAIARSACHRPVGLPSPGRPAIARSACHRPVGLPSPGRPAIDCLQPLARRRLSRPPARACTPLSRDLRGGCGLLGLGGAELVRLGQQALTETRPLVHDCLTSLKNAPARRFAAARWFHRRRPR